MAKRTSGRAILANKLRTLRGERGWSQERLAEVSGLHRTYVSGIERMERNVSIDNIDRLAQAFRISASELLTK